MLVTMVEKSLKALGKGIAPLCLTLMGIANPAASIDLAQSPLFLAQPAAPIVMLSMSVDHELFKKAYNDYSNLEGGILTTDDTTYRNDFTYYGYFDSGWCYTYVSDSNFFTPASETTDHKCSATGGTGKAGAWSGNFLNWATMTRIDIVRQVLYGGKRSTDSTTETVLERTYLPKDVHAFVKVFDGDVSDYTPYTQNSISMCNVSSSEGGKPEVRIANGNWRQWAASEGTQCQWGDGNGTRPDNDGYWKNKNKWNEEWVPGELATVTARAKVCVADKDALGSDRCQQYGSSPATYKPVGILQVHGETGKIKFGLVTGSYKASLSGGVLRKRASLIASNAVAANDEINLTTGQFNTSVDGIISTIDALKIAGYSFDDNKYLDCNTYSIPISTVLAQDTDGKRCSNWGNPLAEIYMETLRYISGADAPISIFHVDDSTARASFPGVAGLTSEGNNWKNIDPMSSDEWCANCSVILLSTGSNSFDGDDLADNDLGDSNADISVETYTNEVGNLEFDTFSGSYFDGSSGHCTVSAVTNLSDISGICPELPALQGTYNVAGLAYYARTEDIRSDRQGAQTIKTYAVDLAESLPSFAVPVGSGEVTFLPACESKKGTDPWLSCSLIDVQVESLTLSADGEPTSGSYLFYWEDSLWGNDYDLDGAQRIEFCVGSACNDNEVNSSQIKLKTSVPYARAGNSLQFSYTVTGTMSDGLVSDWAERPGGTDYDALDDSSDIPDNVTSVTKIFTVGDTSATLLKKPLYYAAKYGGFNDLDGDGTPKNTENDAREWDVKNNLTGVETPDGVPDNYFNVSNPAELEESLDQVLRSIVGDVASGSAAAANSTQLGTDTVVYQAKFSSLDWSGELIAVNLNEDDGSVEGAKWSTSDAGNDISHASRKVYTSSNGTSLIEFKTSNWGSLNADQQLTLGGGSEELGKKRINWVRGENVTGFRTRENWLGDIINSDPVFAGRKSFRFERLPDALGGDEYQDYINGDNGYSAKKSRTEVLYVGANDGMLHAFNANTGKEIFAYIPSMVYDKLRNISALDYGTGANPHQYLVDGPLFVGDAFIHGSWRNVLVGTLGAGGRGVYALDVTNPNAPSLLFELTEVNYPALGNVLGQPLVAPVGSRWKIIFGNGYNSTGQDADLFVIDLERPTDAAVSKVITTGDTSANGLAAPALATNGAGVVVAAYAGDLKGNMWKFKLEGDAVNSWQKSYLLYKALDDDDKTQPITAAPTLGVNKILSGSLMVYFGTGQYFVNGDNDDKAVQSFYAIADQGAAVTNFGSDRDKSLHQKAIASEANGVRTLTGERKTTNGVVEPAMDWVTYDDGWYIDFKAGERIISKPLLAFDRLIFPTLIPSAELCDFGGSGWLMEMVAVGDRHISHTVLGSSGKYMDNAVLSITNFVRSGDKAIFPIGDIRGNLDTDTGDLPPTAFGRMSWRQIH